MIRYILQDSKLKKSSSRHLVTKDKKIVAKCNCLVARDRKIK